MSNIDYYSKYKKYKAKYLLLQYGGIIPYEEAEKMLYEYKSKILNIVSSIDDKLIFQNLRIKVLFSKISRLIIITDNELKKIIKDKKDDVKEMIKELINKLPTDTPDKLLYFFSDIQKRTLILAIETLFNVTNIEQSEVLDKSFFTSLKEIIMKMLEKYKIFINNAVIDIINAQNISKKTKDMINSFIKKNNKINAEEINNFIDNFIDKTEINIIEKRKLNLIINDLFKRMEMEIT